MSFFDCINKNKNLTPKQKQTLLEEYDAYYQKYQKSMPNVDAASAAALKYVQLKAGILSAQKRNAMKDILQWKEINASLDKEIEKIDKLKNKNKFSKKLYGKNSAAHAVRQKIESTYTRAQTIERRATLALAEQIEKFRSKLAGVKQDTEGFKNVTQELLGKNTGDKIANADAQAIRKVFDYLHRQYENAGGIIGKLDNYFPQRHNSVLVKRAGFDKWKDFITSRIDIDKMINPETGVAFTRKQLDAALPKIYKDIVTNGLDDVALRAKEGKQTFGKGGGIQMRHSSSRFFHFKDADAFLQYNQMFGSGDEGLFDVMMGHIQTMSRDIGIMQELGPKPDSQIARMKLKVSSHLEDGTSPQANRTIQGMYDTLAGRNSYSGAVPMAYDVVSSLQNWLRASLLGGAPVSALSDSFFAAFSAKANGIPVMKVMKTYYGQFNPLDPSDRRMARRHGLVAGAASGRSFASARFADDISGGNSGVTGWMAGFTNRASGLGVMTDSARTSLILSTQGYLAELKHTNVKFGDLPIAMREAFDRWDINETDYENFKKAEFHEYDESGADFIRPDDVAKVSVESARKLEMWLIDMSNQASNEPRLLTKAITSGAVLGEAKTGTLLRAGSSSLMMFKSFGITVLNNHMLPTLRRMADPNSSDRFTRMGLLMLGTTIMGAAAIQAKDVMYGKTPRDMNGRAFWNAAFLQGGGFGIFGDFLFADQSRFGNTIIESAAGPVAGTVADAIKVFKGNFDRSLDEGTETKFFADLYQMAERNIPMAKLWYTRLLLERMMLDHVERAVDPKFDTRMRKIENKMKKEKGQEFWWKPR